MRVIKESGGKARSVLAVLEMRVSVPEELARQILAERDMTVLSRWLKVAAKVDTIEAFVEGIA